MRYAAGRCPRNAANDYHEAGDGMANVMVVASRYRLQ